MPRRFAAALAIIVSTSLIAAGGCAGPGGRTVAPENSVVSGQDTPGGEEESASIVYVIDGSTSMLRIMGAVKYELKRVICELSEEKRFQVIFYGATVSKIPGSEPVPATEKSKAAALRLIDDYVVTDRGDGPEAAFEHMFACRPRPDIIYFLAGDRVRPSLVQLVHRLSKGCRPTIYTLRVAQYAGDDSVLKELAAAGGGTYKFVTEDDLDRLIRQE